MRAGRLLSILITLQLQGRVSARELAEKFEVSKRTIYRDVEELSASGVPIYAEHGAAGGFELLQGWQTRLTGMTAREAEALSFAHLPQAAGELGLGPEAATAQLKFLASMPSASSEAARRVAERFHLDPTPWHRRASVAQPWLKDLAQAVWESRRVEVDYQSWKGRARRLLEPLGIVMKAGEWYFLASRNGKPATFKLANVHELTVLKEVFKRPRGFELARHWNESVSLFERGLRRGEARLRVKPGALSRIDRLGADMYEPVYAAKPDGNGEREAVVAIESIAHAAALLLGFGEDVEVLEPAELRSEILRRAQAVVRRYGI
jgi:predicted DNA-binding transcriptional regulator YafY